MEGLLHCTKGVIVGGDLPLSTKGLLMGGFGFMAFIWKEIIRLHSKITTIVNLHSRTHR